MSYLLAALVAVLFLIMILALFRQQTSHLIDMRAAERDWRAERLELVAAATAERQQLIAGAEAERIQLLARAREEQIMLLNRIQHPEYFQPVPVEYPTPEPPRDAEEMQYVGTEVPDFVHVGYGDAPTTEMDKVGEVIDG